MYTDYINACSALWSWCFCRQLCRGKPWFALQLFPSTSTIITACKNCVNRLYKELLFYINDAKKKTQQKKKYVHIVKVKPVLWFSEYWFFLHTLMAVLSWSPVMENKYFLVALVLVALVLRALWPFIDSNATVMFQGPETYYGHR